MDKKTGLDCMPKEILEQIVLRLDSTDIAKLGRTCRWFEPTATRILYRRDGAAEGLAVLWAVKRERELNEKDDSTSINILLLAKMYGANLDRLYDFRTENFGNYISISKHIRNPAAVEWGPAEDRRMTALAIAASKGSTPIVEWLVKEGANTRIPTIHLQVPQNPPIPEISEMPMPTHQRADGTRDLGRRLGLGSLIRDSLWSPLLIPICARYWTTMDILVRANSPSVVASKPRAFRVNVLHLVAALDEWKTGRRLVEMFPNELNRPMLEGNPPSASPLSIAVSNNNVELAIVFLDAGADPNIIGLRDMPPLISAVQRCRRAVFNLEHITRRNYVLIEKLLEKGANVDCRSRFQQWTPLIVAADPSDWASNSLWRDMKPVFEILVKHGCNINLRSGDGHTAITMLCNRILTTDQSKGSLFKALDFLVDNGGSFNIPFPGGQTIFGRVILRSPKVDWQLFHRLVQNEAYIDPAEVDDVLLAWLADFRLRASKMKWEKLVAHASKRAVRKAYQYADQHKSVAKNRQLHNALAQIGLSPPID